MRRRAGARMIAKRAAATAERDARAVALLAIPITEEYAARR